MSHPKRYTEEELRIRRNAAVSRYYQRNKEKISAQRKAVYYADLENARAFARSKYQKYREAGLKSSRRYKEKNRDKVLAYSRRTGKAKSEREREVMKDHYIVTLLSKSMGVPPDQVRGNTELIAIHRSALAIKRLHMAMFEKGFKICKECKGVKPLGEFEKAGKSLKSRCKPCYAEYRKKYKK